jgi:hypothetical protein
MKKLILLIPTIIISFGFAACDLINSDEVDKVVNETLRDNPLDSGFWDRRSSYPVDGVGYPVTFVIDGMGYAGLGTYWGEEDRMLKDLYMYDPETNEWEKKKDYPGAGKQAAVAFIFNNEAYIAGGLYLDTVNDEWVYSLDCWKYSSVSDSWTEMASITEEDAEGLSFSDNHWSAVYDGKGYMSTNSSSDYFVYDQSLDSWEKQSFSSNNPYLDSYRGGFIHSGEGSKYYGIVPDFEYDEDWSLTGLNGFDLYSRDLSDLSSDPAALFSEQLPASDYPAGITNDVYDGNTYYTIPPVTLFNIGSSLYMFSNSVPGSDLLSFNLDGTGSPEHLDWPSGLTESNSSYWCSYPMVFDDKVYILAEDGSFYIYKP